MNPNSELGYTPVAVTPVANRPSHASRPELILYISSGSSASFRGVQNLLRALSRLAKSEYALRIVDLSREALDGSRPDDKIMFTPTLVRRSPAPRAWLMGDLSDARALESFLLLAGLER